MAAADVTVAIESLSEYVETEIVVRKGRRGTVPRDIEKAILARELGVVDISRHNQPYYKRILVR